MSSVKLSLPSLTVGNNFDRLLGGYQTLRPRLAKYCRGRVPGIPGGVDASLILRYFTEFDSFAWPITSQWFERVEDINIMSTKYRLPAFGQH